MLRSSRSVSRCRRHAGEKGWRRPLGWLRRRAIFFALSFSSLTRRIVSLNLAASSPWWRVLYLSQFRRRLIDARAQSLLVQLNPSPARLPPPPPSKPTPSPSIGPPARPQARRKLRRAGRILRADFRSIRSASRRCWRADLATRRVHASMAAMRHDPRQRSLYGRGDVLRFELPPPSTEKPASSRRTISVRTGSSRRPAALSRTGPETARATRKSCRRSTASRAAWCGSTTAAR